MRIAHEVLCEQNALGGRFTQISQLAKAVRRVLPPTEVRSRAVGSELEHWED